MSGDRGRRTQPLAIVLLPGLEGTGLLFRRFLAATPREFEPQVMPLPQAGNMAYSALADLILPKLPADRPYVLLGESFAGPLALEIARRRPAGLVAVVLCVTFVRPPSWSWLRFFARDWLFVARPPSLGFRLVLAGRHADAELLEEVRQARRSASGPAMAARLREVLSVDARAALRDCPVPVFALHGQEDRLVRSGSAQTMRKARPNLAEVTLEGPHLLLQTKPRECWAAIADFVRSTEASGGRN
ncbi:MAG: alpha/beta hydrolase [Acidobacteriota bacterium]